MMANGGLERLMANPSMRNMVRSHLLRPGRRADRFWRSGRTHAERRRNAGHRGPSERSGDAKAGRGYDGRRRRSWCRSMSIKDKGKTRRFLYGQYSSVGLSCKSIMECFSYDPPPCILWRCSYAVEQGLNSLSRGAGRQPDDKMVASSNLQAARAL